MKRKFIVTAFFFFLCSFKMSAQYIADTFSNGYFGSLSPIWFDGNSNYNIINLTSIVKYRPNELAQRGIVPGVTIYGLSYHKYTNGYLYPSATATLEVEYRSGSMDSTIPPITTWNYLLNYTNNQLLGGYLPCAVFNNGSNMNFTWGVGWLQPLIFDVPFVYTGGTLEIKTVWNTPTIANMGVGQVGMSSENTPNDMLSYFFYCSLPPYTTPSGWSHNRPSTIIYHSAAPTSLCNSMPSGGIISGLANVCKNTDFTLYLNNPSAGPGISYQWQKSALSPVNWNNISGATNPVIVTNATDTTLYRCQVTCTNTNQFAYSSSFTVNTHFLNIDSLTAVINYNTITLNCHYNDTTFPVNTGGNYLLGGGILSNYYTPVQFTTDGTYNIVIARGNYCNSDTIYKTVTIGCSGSPTFNDTIGVNHLSVCPGGAAILSVLDTIPSNYTHIWMYNNASTNGFLLASGDSITVYPTVPTTYYDVATCTLSANYKTSNTIHISITPPPIAGTIQATNTTGNYYTLTNTGMSNAQSYKWYFGDGDSSTSLSPSHHYNLAGNYTVAFVTYNSGNGCTDTAFTTVHITTGIEELQGKLFSVSPNPFSESFTVSCLSAKGTITVTDAVGKEVVRLSLSKPTLSIDMKGYSTGVYLIKYENGQETFTQKIIKSN